MATHNHLTLGADRALYQGEMPATGWHRHAAPVLLVGLSGPFALHLPGGRTAHCRSAWIGTGVEHVFDPCGEHVALAYFEPDAPESRSLRAVAQAESGVLFDPVRHAADRSTMAQRLHTFDLDALLRFARPAAPALDPRIARSLALLRLGGSGPLERDAAAAAATLSGSRFNHLFSEAMGVSFRSYRVWSQVRLGMAGLALGRRPGIRLTDAAMHGAFADSAHFSRTFRQTFGMTPSSVLKPLHVVQVLR